MNHVPNWSHQFLVFTLHVNNSCLQLPGRHGFSSFAYFHSIVLWNIILKEQRCVTFVNHEKMCCICINKLKLTWAQRGGVSHWLTGSSRKGYGMVFSVGPVWECLLLLEPLNLSFIRMIEI